jgi:hypothetical protein
MPASLRFASAMPMDWQILIPTGPFSARARAFHPNDTCRIIKMSTTPSISKAAKNRQKSAAKNFLIKNLQ